MQKIQVHLMQYVEKKFMKIDYNMLVQNHVHYIMLSKKNQLMGWWCNG